jgi:hypothetical protein
MNWGRYVGWHRVGVCGHCVVCLQQELEGWKDTKADFFFLRFGICFSYQTHTYYLHPLPKGRENIQIGGIYSCDDADD